MSKRLPSPPPSGARLSPRAAKPAPRRIVIQRGTKLYPFQIEFTTDDGRTRRKVLYAATKADRPRAIRRYLDARGYALEEGTRVRARSVAIDTSSPVQPVPPVQRGPRGRRGRRGHRGPGRP